MHVITSVGRSDTWEGDAASAFLSKVGQLPSKLQEAEDSFGAAAHELNGWQNELASMQQRAQELEQEAVTARQQVETAQANPALQLAGRTVSSPIQLEEDQREYDAAVHQLSMAETDLNALIEQANRLLAQHTGLAQDAAKAIEAAAQLAPDAPGLFASLLGDLETAIQDQILAFQAAEKWCKAHANALNAVGDMLGTASTILGTLGLICDGSPLAPLGVVLDGTAGVISVGALGAHLAASIGGAKVSKTTLAEDGLGAVSFGMFGAAKGATGVVENYEKAEAVVPWVMKTIAKGGDPATAIGGAGLAGSLVGTYKDPSGLGYFIPHGPEQEKQLAYVQAGTSFLPGVGPVGGVIAGGLLVGFENAWRSGSAKDRAAQGGA